MNTLLKIYSRISGYVAALILTAVIFGTAVAASAQSPGTSVSGTVFDPEGETAIGATVIEKGNATNGCVTDIDGKFTIKVKSPKSKLLISYVGYKPLEVSADSNLQHLVLKEDGNILNEVVVVGYGQQKKATLTGSVESVSGKTFESRPITNVGEALQGATPGLMVSRSSSRPGNEGMNFQIRGATSVNGGSPLIIVDGVPAINDASFQNLNMDDIDNISVLKDGAASIYGAKAANGVILVTTKKGKGKLSVSYTFNMRFTTPGRTDFSPSMQEYADVWIQANKEEQVPNWWGWLSEENMLRMRDGQAGIYSTYWGDIFIANANRMDEMFARRNSYQHNLSIAGATDRMDYRVSASFADNKSNLATAYDGQKQYNVRLNYGIKLTDWLRLETAASLVKTDTKSPSVGLDNSIYGYDMPFFPAKNPYGQWYANFGTVGNRQAVAATSDGGRDNKSNFTARYDLRLFADIWNGIKFEASASFQNEEYRRERYVLPVSCYDWFGNPADYAVIDATNTSLTNTTNPSSVNTLNNPGYLMQTNNRFYQYYSGLLRYDNTFGRDHTVSAMIGINAEKWTAKNAALARESFEDSGVYDMNLATGTQGNSGGKSHNGTYSYIARVNYNYAERYMIELMGRRDGNSKFAKKHRFKNFGSVSLGWVFTQEKFLESIGNVMNFGKIRASYCMSGNDAGLGDYDYLSTINQGTVVLGYPATSLVSTSLNNAGLISYMRTWERVEQKNIGIDLGFFNNRLTANFDYFWKDNRGMLSPVTYPSVLGGTAPKTNSGHLAVHGWELSLGWRQTIGDFSYNVGFNISDTRSRLKDLQGADSYGGGKNRTVNGYPLNALFVYRTDGYFKDQAEVDRYYALYGATGAALSNVKQGTTSQLRPGDTKRLDLNGDYVITDNGSATSDLQYIGDANPHYTFGITAGATWKGIDFNIMFQGVGQQYMMRGGWMAYPFAALYSNQNPNFLGKTWTEENPDAQFPRLTSDSEHAKWNYLNNDFMVQNNQYIRLKSFVIGYTLPQKWTRKIYVQKLRIFFAGNDLWEATAIKDGFDPEMGEMSQNSGYPFSRTWSFGLNITF